MVFFALTNEVRQNMPLQVVHVNHWNAQTPSKALGKADTHQKASHQPWTPCKGDGIEIFLSDTGPFYGCIHHWHYVLLVGSRCQFWHHTAIFFVYGLRSGYITQQDAITQHSRTCVVARTFYCKYIHNSE